MTSYRQPSERDPLLPSASNDEEDVDISMNSSRNESYDDDENDGDYEEEEEEDDDSSSTLDNTSLQTLTRRMRCLFTVMTLPIVPLGTMLVVALCNFAFSAIFLDGNFPWSLTSSSSDTANFSPCAHPLRPFAGLSMTLLVYASQHPRVRQRTQLHYRRRCDQIFHTVALLYVYAAVSLAQTCAEDTSTTATTTMSTMTTTTSTGGGSVQNKNNDGWTESDDADERSTIMATNMCELTCPNITHAMNMYVVALEVFTLSLVLPILFLPCIYLWFLREASSDQTTLAALQERLHRYDDDDDDDDENSGAEDEFSFEHLVAGRGSAAVATRVFVTARDILNKLSVVQLVYGSEEEDRKVWIVSSSNKENRSIAKDGAPDCCICMTNFGILNTDQHPSIEDGDIEAQQQQQQQHQLLQDDIVQTPNCGHLFHKKCLASWVSGRWERGSNSNGRSDEEQTEVATNRRARRTTCPLCRADLRS